MLSLPVKNKHACKNIELPLAKKKKKVIAHKACEITLTLVFKEIPEADSEFSAVAALLWVPLPISLVSKTLLFHEDFASKKD